MENFWDVSLDDTLQIATRVSKGATAALDLGEWLANYDEARPTSSNQGTAALPFQRWFKFKEAYSPKFVADTIGALPYKVERCLDSFAGSGTTALTCSFLGIDTINLEVNPFLADLIAAKITPTSAASVLAHYERLIAELVITAEDKHLPDGMPQTMREPGVADRWIFSGDVYDTIRALVRGLKSVPPIERRLLRVLIGSVLVANSNVLINGKGRRYRRNWQSRVQTAADLLSDLDDAVDKAVSDISRFAGKGPRSVDIRCGDARKLLPRVESADLAIFSPPYPNSFDYTDVYNLELWMLGYLKSGSDNRNLRLRTLRSHVQATWALPKDSGSAALAETLNALEAKRSELWNPRIPQMVACYFEDMQTILRNLARILKPGHHAVIAIGDSQYAGVLIDVAEIVCEMARPLGFVTTKREAMRSMRNSSQHGGAFELKEHCLVLERQ